MFCPQCGQRQAAHEVRFCSSCGLPLGAVAEVVARGGHLPAYAPAAAAATPQGPRPLTPRQKGVRQGAMLMLSTLLVVPLVVFLSVFIIGGPEFFVPATAVICFMGGLLRIVYALMFEQHFAAGAPAPPAHAYVPPVMPPNYLGTHERGASLPPAQSIPAQSFRPPRFDTGELSTPPSVTDHTTRLLERRGEEPPQQ